MSSAFPSKEKDSGAKKDRPSGVAAILGANAPANRRGSDSPHIIESRPLAAGHSRQQLPQSTMANQMPSQSQSQFFIPTNLIQTPFPQQLVIPHNFGQFPGQAQLLLNPQGTPLGIVAPCQPRQHGQQQLIYGNDGRLHRPRSPPQQQQQQQQCAPPRINPAFLRAPSARDQPRIYPPLLPAPAPMHISENSGPVPIAPAPQHQHQQPSFLQLIGGNNMILQRLPNGVITLVQQPAHQQGQLFLQPQQMHSQQPIANNFLGDGSSSNHHIPPNIEAPKEPEPIDLPPPLILGGGTSTIEEDVDIHELFMKEVEKHASAKPDVITHILDGFYIQESFEPFPIDAYGCIEALVPHEAIQNLYAPASAKIEQNEVFDDGDQEDKCLYCSTLLSAGKRYEKAPQYCSRECKRKERKRLRSFETSPDEQSTSYTLPVITSPTVKIKPIVDPATAAAPPILSHPPPPPATAVSNKHPTEWTVEEVHNWVMSVNGAQASAEIFKQQEIDGQALMLLNEDHLMRTLGLKLGPAVKLQSALKALKESVGR